MKEHSTPYETQLAANGIRLPCVMCQIRTVDGRKMQSNGVDVFKGKYLAPRSDGISNTLTGVQKDNLIMTNTNMETTLTYHEHPTKQDLLEYFSQRIRIRKMTPKTAFRLMGLTDTDIEKIQAWPFATYAEREQAIAIADKNELNRIKRESIAKTKQYCAAGNSIVVDVLYHIFRTMLLDNQPENTKAPKSLFDFE